MTTGMNNLWQNSHFSKGCVVIVICSLTGLLGLSGCNAPCGTISQGQKQYHDVCISVTFKEHIEVKPDASQLDNTKQRGIAIDADYTTVEIGGDGLTDLVPGHQYNLKGDLVETKENKRFRFYEAIDLSDSRILIAVAAIAIAVCGGVYHSASRRLQSTGKSA
jgi:hypothetical protein